MSARSKVFKSLTIVAWLAIMGWFLRYEAFPDFFTHSVRGYQGLLSSKDVLVKDSWMKITFQGKPMGYTHTQIDTDEGSVTKRFMMRNEMMMNLVLMGTREQINTTADATLDAMYRLNDFSVSVVTRASTTRVIGRRRRGNSFLVTVITGGGRQRNMVEIPDDTIIYSPATDIALSQLKPGQKLTLKTIEPLSMTPATIAVKALEPEKISFQGQEVEAKVLSTEYMGVATRSWIDAEGNVLRQELPLKDFMAESCTPREAINAGVATTDTRDLLKSLAVKVNHAVRHPRDCRKLRLRLTGAKLDVSSITSERQSLDEPEKGNSYLLTIRAAEAPAASPPMGAPAPVEFKPFLASSAYIQANHPEIVAKARLVTRDCTNALDAATAIYEWVHENVDKVASPGIPSALDVLHSMQGDCNEHTYLFTALARAAGLPARVKIGVVYVDDAFYYHAWPSVYVGQWMEMDPTFGQRTVDASHIALCEGELADQMGLVQAIGWLKAELLEEEP